MNTTISDNPITQVDSDESAPADEKYSSLGFNCSSKIRLGCLGSYDAYDPPGELPQCRLDTKKALNDNNNPTTKSRGYFAIGSKQEEAEKCEEMYDIDIEDNSTIDSETISSDDDSMANENSVNVPIVTPSKLKENTHYNTENAIPINKDTLI